MPTRVMLNSVVSLVAIAVPPGPAFVDAIRRVWDRGDAFCVLDPRLPKPEADAAIKALGVDLILDDDGLTTLSTFGSPADPLLPGDALVMATSGSTGHPKAVVHTHSSINASAIATSAAIGAQPDSDTWLACLPLSHIGGLSVVLRALHTDTPVEIHSGFDVTDVEQAARNGATLVSLVTRALRQIDSKLFRSILIGGAAPPASRPSNVIATYGMTETGSGIVYNRTPIDGVEITFDDDDQILLRGPMLFRAYRGGQTPIDDQGWFETGDFGRLGPDGALIVDGRGGDVIISGGEKVWPARAEALLRSLPNVSDAMVVGERHPEWGQQVVAHVVSAGGEPPSLEHIRELVKLELPPWYAPKKLLLVDDLPKTANGKLRRPR